MSAVTDLPRVRYVTRHGKRGQVWGVYLWDGRSRGLGTISLGTCPEAARQKVIELEAGTVAKRTKRRRVPSTHPQFCALPLWAKTCYRNAVQRSIARGCAVLTEDEFLLIVARSAGACELSGIAFVTDGAWGAFSPSLDRIEVARGYEASNCRLVCLMANFAMNSWGYDALLTFARCLIERASLSQSAARRPQQEAAHGNAQEHCIYPRCNCPFDAPADPNWCARGLPQREAAP